MLKLMKAQQKFQASHVASLAMRHHLSLHEVGAYFKPASTGGGGWPEIYIHHIGWSGPQPHDRLSVILATE